MAKNRKIKSESEMTSEEIVDFIESMRNLSAHIDEPTVAISLRVPANILRATKAKAKSEQRKYQSLIVEYIRRGLQS